jgi:hypothetical protein
MEPRGVRALAQVLMILALCSLAAEAQSPRSRPDPRRSPTVTRGETVGDLLAAYVERRLGRRPQPGDHELVRGRNGDRLVVRINASGQATAFSVITQGRRRLGTLAAQDSADAIHECFEERKACIAEFQEFSTGSGPDEASISAGCWQELIECIKRVIEENGNAAR